MHGHDIVVIGGSAGAVEVVLTLARGLPKSLEAAVFLTLHVAAGSRSLLPELLTRAGPLPAVHPRDGDAIERGRVYVAPPDHHLLVDRDCVRVSRGPRHNRMRPAIDPMFRSASRAHGSRVIGVVLSGTLDDGAAGLRTIRERGGIALVQDPASAAFPDMPTNAAATAELGADARHGPDALALALVHRVAAAAGPAPAADPRLDAEWKQYLGREVDMDPFGKPSRFACPECHGVLWEQDDGVAFTCRVGHSYTAEGLLSDHDETLEASLWAAVRAMDENRELRQRIADRFARTGNPMLSERNARAARESATHAERLREWLMARDARPADGEAS